MENSKYKRVILKVSGEALAGEKVLVLILIFIKRITLEVKDLVDMGIEVGLVVGGGNILERKKRRRYG